MKSNKKINFWAILGAVLIFLYQLLPIFRLGFENTGFFESKPIDGSLFNAFLGGTKVATEVIHGFFIIDLMLIISIIFVFKRKNIIVLLIGIFIHITRAQIIPRLGAVLPFAMVLDVMGILIICISSLIYSILDFILFFKSKYKRVE